VTSATVTGKPVILVFGDSLSVGYGVPLERGWVNLLTEKLLKKKYNYKVINASISGDTTQSGLSRLPNAIKLYKPSIIVLELGGNDGLRGLPLVQVKKNLNQMLVMLRNDNIKVLLIGIRLPPNYGPAYTKLFHQLYKDLSKSNNIDLLSFMLEGVAGYEKYMQDDGVHPNTKAQSLVLKNIYQRLKGLL